MGQVLHGSATTTEAIRRAIQHSEESLRALAERYGINQKTVAKWKSRDSVADLPTGPKEAMSTVLSIEEEAIIVAFRKHTLLPLDDCLYSLQATIPYLTRSSLHRSLQRHGISRLPEVEGNNLFARPCSLRVASVRRGASFHRSINAAASNRCFRECLPSSAGALAKCHRDASLRPMLPVRGRHWISICFVRNSG